MARRWPLVFGLAVMLIGASSWIGTRDLVTKTTFDRIEKGMPGEAVDALLGRPTEVATDPGVRTIKKWVGRRGVLVVILDHAGRVKYAEFCEVDWHDGVPEVVWHWVKDSRGRTCNSVQAP
jgi:hypothetical protein